MRDKRGNGERDWGNIDWSNLDLSSLRTRRGGTTPRPPSGRGVAIAIVIFFLLLVPLLLLPLNEFLTDLLWFRSLGYEDVYLRRYTAGFWAFVAFFLIFFLVAVPNLYLALRPQVPRVVVDTDRPRPSALAQTLRLLWVITIPAFFFGLAGGDQWDQLLRWLNAVPFGVTDPLFGKDVGFYFFTLPVLEFARGWAIAAVLVIAAGVVFLYAVRGVISIATSSISRGNLDVAGRTALALARPARAHLSVLGGIFLILVAFGYILDQYDLLFRTEPVLTGAGFASVNARIPALTILAVVVGIAALACFANAFARTVWVLGGAIVVWFAASILINGVYPAVVQNFVVAPDQLNKERPYLERNIAATRAAYSLDKIDESLFNVADTPSQAEATREFADTLSVRLWDYHRLILAFDQLQALRQYYDFQDVDVDRYAIGGREVPIMLSARELNTTALAQQTWVNRHLQFTHGFGAVMTPVGGVAAEGRPQFLVKDIPPQGDPKIDEPRIYYGELTNDYVIVNSAAEEFDYPQEGTDARTRYSGKGGVGISSVWDRLLFTLRFGETNLLFSDQIRSDSRILFHRNIAGRERLIAPFLEYDRDPYLVVAEGKLWWINDAYTVGDRYPYSERFNELVRGGTTVADGGLNYIRNSVKVVTNAYDGSISYYVVDETDPVVRNLRAIYPSLFKSLAEMPQTLKDHLRYPEDLFSIQAQVFAIYHMTDIDNFYNRGDAWRIANEVQEQGTAKAPIEPYYVTTRLPGSDRKEFILFVPMTPAGGQRDNMVAWIAGRADAPDYGKLRVLRLPQDRQISGPLQTEGRIDADATIKQQLTLLCPQGGGSQCFRGNLLVLPVGNSFVYVEGLFVQATQSRIPELQRVILATQDRVVMAPTFAGALDALFGQGTTPPVTQPPPVTTPPSAGVIADLVKAASDHYLQ
ncbi:MAG: UPF0182 family protein, partial [Chloroflexota bacterium]|nr:UPF0182 family protein [Chloroflexota bacterium]